MTDYKIFELGDVALQSGECLKQAQLAYQTYGVLSPQKDNLILLPTFYTGSHLRNEGFFGNQRALNPTRHFIVSVNLFGNGFSTSPSNAHADQRRGNFPLITLWDNVHCQYRLLTERYAIERIALVTGWSMAGCQAYQWAAQYPDKVAAILPFCASAKTSHHNNVFLEGLKAAMYADQHFNHGNYSSPPIGGLKAFARVYAGWAFSQTFYRHKLHQQLGFASAEELLVDWENDHIQNHDANNLLAVLATWQAADISDNPLYHGDLKKALNTITARTTLMPCTHDLYFTPEDNAIEAQHIFNCQYHPYDSPWGHCAASPGNDQGFTQTLDGHIQQLLDNAPP